jgi:anti-sigma B factor antagonist
MPPISVTLTRRDPPAAVVALMGEHDAYSSEHLKNELAVIVDGGRHVIVDLSDASFIDSTTLSVLLAGQKKAGGKGLGFALVLPNRDYTQVHQILEITGLERSFAIYAKLDQALAAVRKGHARDAA